MVFKQDTQTHDFGASPSDSHIFTLAAGHTIGAVFSRGLTAASGAVGMAVGTGGSIDKGATDYLSGSIWDNSTAIVARDFARLEIGNVSTGQWLIDFFNMNTTAPVLMAGMGITNVHPNYTCSIRKATTALDQIEIFNPAAVNFTAGVVELVSYKRKAAVSSVTADAIDETLAGLKKNKGMIVACGWDIDFSSAQNTGRMLVSTGGVIQAGASDYLQSVVGANGIDLVEASAALGDVAAYSVPGGFGAVGYGFMEADIRSAVTHHMDFGVGASSLGQLKHMGWFATAEANNEWTVRSSIAPSTGTMYFTQYSV